MRVPMGHTPRSGWPELMGHGGSSTPPAPAHCPACAWSVPMGPAGPSASPRAPHALPPHCSALGCSDAAAAHGHGPLSASHPLPASASWSRPPLSIGLVARSDPPPPPPPPPKGSEVESAAVRICSKLWASTMASSITSRCSQPSSPPANRQSLTSQSPRSSVSPQWVGARGDCARRSKPLVCSQQKAQQAPGTPSVEARGVPDGWSARGL